MLAVMSRMFIFLLSFSLQVDLQEPLICNMLVAFMVVNLHLPDVGSGVKDVHFSPLFLFTS